MNKSKSDAASLFELEGESYQMESVTSSSFEDNYWKPDVKNISGKKTYLLRFLPDIHTRKLYVRENKHYVTFLGDNGAYIPCLRLTTGKCEVCSLYHKLHQLKNSMADDIKLKKFFYTVAQIIDDPDNSGNNGRFVIYKYGPEVYNILQTALESGLKYYSLKEGAVFELTITAHKLGSAIVPRYMMSSFQEPSPIQMYVKGRWVDVNTKAQQAELEAQMLAQLPPNGLDVVSPATEYSGYDQENVEALRIAVNTRLNLHANTQTKPPVVTSDPKEYDIDDGIDRAVE